VGWRPTRYRARRRKRKVVSRGQPSALDDRFVWCIGRTTVRRPAKSTRAASEPCWRTPFVGFGWCRLLEAIFPCARIRPSNCSRNGTGANASDSDLASTRRSHCTDSCIRGQRSRRHGLLVRFGTGHHRSAALAARRTGDQQFAAHQTISRDMVLNSCVGARRIQSLS